MHGGGQEFESPQVHKVRKLSSVFLDTTGAISYNIMVPRKIPASENGEIAFVKARKWIYEKELNRLDNPEAISYNQFCVCGLELAVPASEESE